MPWEGVKAKVFTIVLMRPSGAMSVPTQAGQIEMIFTLLPDFLRRLDTAWVCRTCASLLLPYAVAR